MILGRLVPNAPALWYGASPPAECADERESPEDEVALVTEKEEPERSGSGEESNGAAGGTKTDKGKAEGDSIASAHQEEEEPQQVSQVGTSLPRDSKCFLGSICFG